LATAPGIVAIDAYTVSVYSREVIRSFADKATEQVFYGEDTKAARRLPKALWPLVRRKLDLLHGASSLTDLAVPPGNRLEVLRGDQAGRQSIRVNDQYRITFRFEADGVWEVLCEDYH
jgi:proteic killer suppression protein